METSAAPIAVKRAEDRELEREFSGELWRRLHEWAA